MNRRQLLKTVLAAPFIGFMKLGPTPIPDTKWKKYAVSHSYDSPDKEFLSKFRRAFHETKFQVPLEQRREQSINELADRIERAAWGLPKKKGWAAT